MPFLKKVGENVVPVGYYTDPNERESAVLAWLNVSLFPFFKNLEKAIKDEFKLIPQMLSYDAFVGNEWHKGLSSLSVLENIMRGFVRKGLSGPFQIQIVIECSHPHSCWGTVLDVTFDRCEKEVEGEMYDCHGFTIEAVWFNLDEPMSLAAGLELTENVLVELRINYVQNS
jgi:hypothetical protein